MMTCERQNCFLFKILLELTLYIIIIKMLKIQVSSLKINLSEIRLVKKTFELLSFRLSVILSVQAIFTLIADAGRVKGLKLLSLFYLRTHQT